jgi:hypothetical protein
LQVDTTMSKVYDINFFFPVPEALESERLKLIPFIAEFIAPYLNYELG